MATVLFGHDKAVDIIYAVIMVLTLVPALRVVALVEGGSIDGWSSFYWHIVVAIVMSILWILWVPIFLFHRSVKLALRDPTQATAKITGLRAKGKHVYRKDRKQLNSGS